MGQISLKAGVQINLSPHSVVSVEYFATVWQKLGIQKLQANGTKLRGRMHNSLAIVEWTI